MGNVADGFVTPSRSVNDGIFASGPVAPLLLLHQPPARKTKHSDDDERELRQWIASAAVGSQKVWKIGKDRRKYLHRLCDLMMDEIHGLHLEHHSEGDQRSKQLYITIRAKSGVSAVIPQVADAAADLLLPPRKTVRQLFSPAEGNRLGGGTDLGGATGISAREAAAMAAISRLEKSTGGRKRPPKRPASHTSYKPAENSSDNSVIDLCNDSDDDKKPAAKRLKINNNVPSYDYQPGDKVMVVDSNGRKRGPLQIIRVHITGHVTIREKEGQENKLDVQTVQPCVDLMAGDEEEDQYDMGKPKIPFASAKASVFSASDDDAIIEILDSPPSLRPAMQHRTNSSMKRNPNATEEAIDLSDSGSGNLKDQTASLTCVREALNVLIDSRERSRNATPRELRIGLTQQLEAGCLKAVWPKRRPLATVEEKTLAYGDFAFEVCSGQNSNKHPSRLSVVVERKIVRDLIQRSSRGDHWKQLQRMRDHCNHAIMLIENDTQFSVRFDAYGSMGLEPKPSHHLIENDADVFRFVGRAILSSKKIGFIQTRDHQGTYRSIGALALVAAESSIINRDAPTTPPTAASEQQKLQDRLTSGGIHWQIASAIAKEIGSVTAVENLISSCTTTRAKDMVVMPVLMNAVAGQEDVGNLQNWSAAVSRVIRASSEDCTEKLSRYTEIKNSFGKTMPFDSGTLLKCVYDEDSPDAAVERALQYSENLTHSGIKRQVHIEATDDMRASFPEPSEDAFYKCTTRSFPTTTVKMSTRCGNLSSDALILYMITGEKLLNEINIAINSTGTQPKFLYVARHVAQNIDQHCSRGSYTKNDRRVILIRGLPPVLVEAKKSGSYRDEVPVLCEMVSAFLMLEYGYVVLQAIRKKADETNMILQQMALACYHYQYLTKEI
jgi:ERCC4-type nuclease